MRFNVSTNTVPLTATDIPGASHMRNTLFPPSVGGYFAGGPSVPGRKSHC